MMWMAILLRDTLVVWGGLLFGLVLWASFSGGEVTTPGWIMTLGPIAAWVRAEMCNWHEPRV